MAKRITKVAETLNALRKTDTESLLLFLLYQLKDDPKYATLSELIYLVDNKSFFNLLNYYGGMTIRIPTLEEFKVVSKAMLLYQLCNIEHESFDSSLKSIKDDCSDTEITQAYNKLIDILKLYEVKIDA